MPLNKTTFTSLMDDFSPFETKPHIAVAVSGGADSMALAILTHQWVQDKGGIATALIIDHQLRKNSTTEAMQVSKWLDALNMRNVIMAWEGVKPKTRVQETARHKRYELLEEWCQNHHVLHLMTAHHGDDQWETMMQRLSRHSGIQGLQGIQADVTRSFGRIIRPFLKITKTEIIKFLNNQQQHYITDPSNDNESFERVRWRKERATWIAEGFNEEKIREVMSHSHQLQQKNEAILGSWIINNLILSEYGYISINRKGWEYLESPLKIQLIKKITAAMMKQKYPTPIPTINHILEGLEKSRGITGGGCYFLNRQSEIIIVRETRHLPQIIIDQPQVHWDRFIITFHNENFYGQTIEAVGQKRAENLSASLGLHSYVLASLPCIVIGQDTIVLHERKKDKPLSQNIYAHVELRLEKPLMF